MFVLASVVFLGEAAMPKQTNKLACAWERRRGRDGEGGRVGWVRSKRTGAPARLTEHRVDARLYALRKHVAEPCLPGDKFLMFHGAHHLVHSRRSAQSPFERLKCQ